MPPGGVVSQERGPNPSLRHSTRHVLRAIAVTLLLVSVAAPAVADELTDARQQREQAREERARTAARLDTLRATDRELEAAARALNARLADQEATVADARAAQARAEAEVDDAQRRLDAVEGEIAELERLVGQRAVRAYMNGGRSGDLATVFATGDIDEVTRKQAYFDQVARQDHDLLDQLRAAREDRIVDEERAQDAAGRAAAERARSEEALEELERTRAEQVRVQRALDARIRGFVAEVDALAKEESRLTSLIQRKEAELRERERRRREAEARARREAAARAAEARGAAERAAAERAAAQADDGATDRVETPRPDASPAPSAAGLIWPVSGVVTSEFGWRWGRMHQGIDIAAPIGTPIRAAADGTVLYAGWLGGYGNAVLIDHGDGFTTVYGHQSQLATAEGAPVDQGELIGYVGSTGHSTGPHLHFETRVDGAARNPRIYLP